jgi:tetratricopeptide (TPR) repeat protein
MKFEAQVCTITIFIVVVLPFVFASARADFHNFGPDFYGPYDYTNPKHVREKLPIVEKYHFDSGIESLRGPVRSSTVAGHLWYVLRSFPNHHRALHAMAKLWRNHLERGTIPKGISPHRTPEYLFDRAIRFAPHDGTVRVLYGIHLYKLGKLNEALEFYKQAVAIMPDSAEVNYNLGLLYLDQKEYTLASEYAQKAYKLGFPLPGLRNKLIAAGVWKGSNSREKSVK